MESDPIGNVLRDIAAKVERGEMKTKSVWIAINGAGAYAAFYRLLDATGGKYMEYLPNVLRKSYKEPVAMAALLRKAAEAPNV